MVRLKIDGMTIEVREGATLLEAARQAGVDVPTLCYEKEAGALTSCMLCGVRDRTSGRTLPACSAKAADGMDIDTQSDEVRAARAEILRMLLSEHVGDCEAPCSRICPAGLNIPRMLRHLADGDRTAAADVAKRDLVFPATLGWLCSAPCERGCRRGSYDKPIPIRSLHRDLPKPAASDAPARSTGKKVAVIGAGLAGLAAAWTVRQCGHACRVYEKRATACAALYALSPEQLPREILDAEIASVRHLGVEFLFDHEIGDSAALETLAAEYDAVVVACDLTAPAGDRMLVVRKGAMPVRDVAAGKAAARRVDALLRGVEGGVETKRFNAQIGPLRAEELAAYGVERVRAAASEAAMKGRSQVEAGRCLHCDCLKPASCRLRRYAEEYGLVSPVKRLMPRPSVEAIQRAGDVLFEPGKCIKCGICVEITRASGGGLGLTFGGRGLVSRVQTPFDEPLAAAFVSNEVALRCVRACPTGALALCSEEETE